MVFRLTTYSYQEISELGNLILDVYKKKGINLPPNSSIMNYIHSAEKLYSSFLEKDKSLTKNKKDFFVILENTLECLRVGSALKWIKDKSTLDRYLKHILKGFLDPTIQKRTEAKDFCFELQMVEILESAGVNANLIEPPDIVFNLDDLELAIACKCAYSRENLETNIRKARRQIIEAKRKGLIALSIDGIADHSRLLFVENKDDFYNLIDEETTGFVRRYEESFHQWIQSRNVIGILISLSTLTILKERNLPTTAQYMVIKPLCSENSPYYGRLLKLKDLLEKRRI